MHDTDDSSVPSGLGDMPYPYKHTHKIHYGNYNIIIHGYYHLGQRAGLSDQPKHMTVVIYIIKSIIRHTDAIKWNFTKFLISPDGKTVKRYAPVTSPGKLSKDIEAMLA